MFTDAFKMKVVHGIVYEVEGKVGCARLSVLWLSEQHVQ